MFTQSLADKLDATQQISKAQIPNDIQRLTELYLRDRLLSLEERAATYLARRYKRFTRDVRSLMTETASDMGLTNATAPSSYLWRSLVEDTLPLAVSQLERDVTVQMYRASLAAYVGMYYGRAWALESMVAPEVRVNAPPINSRDVNISTATTPPKTAKAFCKGFIGDPPSFVGRNGCIQPVPPSGSLAEPLPRSALGC
jgi:hypothetical protein